MFAPNVGQASRAGRTEKKKKDSTTRLDLYTIALNSIKKCKNNKYHHVYIIILYHRYIYTNTNYIYTYVNMKKDIHIKHFNPFPHHIFIYIKQ